MTWLPWSLLAVSVAMLFVESWFGRQWRGIAMEYRDQAEQWKKQSISLAVELAACKRDRGKS